MKFLYRYHIKYKTLFDIENFYSNMAKQGLLLCKRGFVFSKFQQSEPTELNYQVIHVSQDSIFSKEESFYQKLDSLKNWDYVTHCCGFYVFKLFNELYQKKAYNLSMDK